VVMNDVKLKGAVAKALKKAQKRGDLPGFDIPEEIPIERPKQEAMGDYATPICMQLARYARSERGLVDVASGCDPRSA